MIIITNDFKYIITLALEFKNIGKINVGSMNLCCSTRLEESPDSSLSDFRQGKG